MLVVAGVGIWKLTNQPAARAQSGCSAATLQGAYGFSLSGFFYDPNGFQGVYAAAGRAVADGSGGITGTQTINLDGTPSRGVSFAGTYNINADCTGTMNIDSGNSNFDLVVTSGGKEISLVDYDPNFMLTGTAKLQ